ncbi:hypothetical protein [Alteromonas macleodii]
MVAEHINLATVKGGSSAHIEISKQTDGQYVVTTVHIIDLSTKYTGDDV